MDVDKIDPGLKSQLEDKDMMMPNNQIFEDKKINVEK